MCREGAWTEPAVRPASVQRAQSRAYGIFLCRKGRTAQTKKHLRDADAFSFGLIYYDVRYGVKKP